MITSSNNSSHILKKDVSDIFEQIKKKAEDLSTSEGSMLLLQNLSNPTNLTNPQIISLRRPGVADNSDESKNKSKINKSRNTVRRFKKVKSEISELHDEFLISEQIKKLLLQKEPKKVFDKPKKRIYDDYPKIRSHEKDRKNRTIQEIKQEDGDLFSKLTKINYMPKDKKEIRVNKRKNISTRDYVSNTKEIQLMKYINKNKIQRLNMLTNLKKTELESLSHTILSLENNKDFIKNNYNEKYASYVNFLKKRRDEEEKNNFNLFLTEENIKHEITQLQIKYNKKKKEKNFLINMTLLLIQIKEKMRTIPEKAILLFDKNISMKASDGHRKVKKPKTVYNKTINKLIFDEEINKIIKYRGRVIYNDIFEFDYDYQQIEDRVRNKFKEKDKLDIEIAELKDEYNKVKEETEYDPYAEDKEDLIKIIDKLKIKNEELKQDIISLKVKFSDERHNILNKKKHILKKSLSTLSLKKNYSSGNMINQNNNYFFNTSNLHYDNYSTLYGFKNMFTLSNFNFNKMREVSDLYISCFKLYNTSKDNLFEEFDINFDVDNNMKSPKINEDLVIIKMLEYIDQVVTLLIIQRSNYMSKPNLKKKYEKIRNLLEREKRRMRFINNIREEEQQQRIKLRELELKKNKVNYIPTKKSELKYYFKAQKDHFIKLKQLAELRKPSTFEDFMYDIMV